MSDLSATYERLARPWTHDQLAARYQEAIRRGEQALQNERDALPRPISLLATAIPPSASLTVAIHVIHALPVAAGHDLAQHLLDTAGKNAANAMHLFHQALELDGLTHGYSPADWLAVVYDIAAQLLESARLDQEPSSLVQHAQDAVGWLASAVIDLDQDAPETSAALADGLGRLLTLSVFVDAALERVRARDQ
jgi:hypothetical protein